MQCTGVFNYCTTDYERATVVIFGAPMDYTVSFKAGSRFGPEGIRSASYGLEQYSPYLDRHLSSVPFADAGDLVLPFGNVGKSLELINAKTREIVAAGKIPLVLGGEHLVSLPVIRALAEKHPGLRVLHFDAHADLRDTFAGEKLSHATVMRRVVELLGPGRVYHYGIRSGEKEEFLYAAEYSHMHRYEVLKALAGDLEELSGHPVYVTLDIDVMDPVYCPGTGTPEPFGISAKEMLAAIHAMAGLKIVGMDLVEVAPPLDRAGVTAILAAKLLIEALVSFWTPAE